MEISLSQHERNFMVEWLSLITEYKKSYWEKYSDSNLQHEFNDHIGLYPDELND
ncbi:hypothetical protein [Bacillus velezensis]|uniref:hypothetical protein n=1 Tax=Bacillus velezensis TaxID=492670 RepID=UPI0012AB8942|nr:hypothetical protein [Bacillus velezensis]